VPYRTTTCGSCPAPIIWARTPAGKRMPVDAEPTPDGNVTLVPPLESYDSPLAVVSSERDPSSTRYTSHFATCPNADSHRRSH